MPKRIKRRMSKGWRLPQNVACVTRPMIFGNPFVGERAAEWYRVWLSNRGCKIREVLLQAKTEDCDLMMHPAYRLDTKSDVVLDRLGDLRGRDLACWCDEGAACHADVLLEFANR